MNRALTDREWQARAFLGHDGCCPTLQTDGRMNIDGCIVDDGRERHAVAALALYGQPYGFTDEDVTVLRHFSVRAQLLPVARPDKTGQYFGQLADRIEALLPRLGAMPEFVRGTTRDADGQPISATPQFWQLWPPCC